MHLKITCPIGEIIFFLLLSSNIESKMITLKVSLPATLCKLEIEIRKVCHGSEQAIP